MAITEQRAVLRSSSQAAVAGPVHSDDHGAELDWLGYVAASMVRPQDPDEVALNALCAIADIVGATCARIVRVEGGRHRLVGECVKGLMRRADAPLSAEAVSEHMDTHGSPRSSAGDVLHINAGAELVAVIQLEGTPTRSLDPTQRMLLDRVSTIAGAAVSQAQQLQQERARLRELEELDASQSRFFGIAAHELRGPLTVLVGYLSLLEDGAFGEVPDGFRQVLPQLNTRLAEMDSIMSAMLETSRIEQNRVELMRSPVDLRELADEALRRCELFVHPGQLLSLRCGDHPIEVFVDRDRIVGAITSLVHNAIKFSPRHTDVHCTVSVDGEAVRVAVSDEGIGIAAEDMAVLFTRFGRIHGDGDATNVPGTGLGLYLAREIARLHDGDLTVESQSGRGSTFTLSLPLT